MCGRVGWVSGGVGGAGRGVRGYEGRVYMQIVCRCRHRQPLRSTHTHQCPPNADPGGNAPPPRPTVLVSNTLPRPSLPVRWCLPPPPPPHPSPPRCTRGGTTTHGSTGRAAAAAAPAPAPAPACAPVTVPVHVAAPPGCGAGGDTGTGTGTDADTAPGTDTGPPRAHVTHAPGSAARQHAEPRTATPASVSAGLGRLRPRCVSGVLIVFALGAVLCGWRARGDVRVCACVWR